MHDFLFGFLHPIAFQKRVLFKRLIEQTPFQKGKNNFEGVVSPECVSILLK